MPCATTKRMVRVIALFRVFALASTLRLLEA